MAQRKVDDLGRPRRIGGRLRKQGGAHALDPLKRHQTLRKPPGLLLLRGAAQTASGARSLPLRQNGNPVNVGPAAGTDRPRVPKLFARGKRLGRVHTQLRPQHRVADRARRPRDVAPNPVGHVGVRHDKLGPCERMGDGPGWRREKHRLRRRLDLRLGQHCVAHRHQNVDHLLLRPDAEASAVTPEQRKRHDQKRVGRLPQHSSKVLVGRSEPVPRRTAHAKPARLGLQLGQQLLQLGKPDGRPHLAELQRHPRHPEKLADPLGQSVPDERRVDAERVERQRNVAELPLVVGAGTRGARPDKRPHPRHPGRPLAAARARPVERAHLEYQVLQQQLAAQRGDGPGRPVHKSSEPLVEHLNNPLAHGVGAVPQDAAQNLVRELLDVHHGQSRRFCGCAGRRTRQGARSGGPNIDRPGGNLKMARVQLADTEARVFIGLLAAANVGVSLAYFDPDYFTWWSWNVFLFFLLMVSADVLRTNVAWFCFFNALFVTIGVLSVSRHAEPNRPLAHPPAAP